MLASHRSTQQAQTSVDAVHGHFGHSLQYVIDTLGLRGLSHPGLVNHHSSEAFVVLLLQYEYHLSHTQLLRVGKVEGCLPAGVSLKECHDLADLRRELVLRTAGLD